MLPPKIAASSTSKSKFEEQNNYTEIDISLLRSIYTKSSPTHIYSFNDEHTYFVQDILQLNNEDQFYKYFDNSKTLKYNIPITYFKETSSNDGLTSTKYFKIENNYSTFLNNRILNNKLFNIEELLEKSNIEIDFSFIKSFIISIIGSLHELHSLGITHNIFHSNDLQQTLLLEEDEYSSIVDSDNKKSLFSLENDIFMLGSTLLRLLTNEQLDCKETFNSDMTLNEKLLIVNNLLSNNFKNNDTITNLLNIILQCVDFDPINRPTIIHLKELVEKIFNINFKEELFNLEEKRKEILIPKGFSLNNLFKEEDSHLIKSLQKLAIENYGFSFSPSFSQEEKVTVTKPKRRKATFTSAIEYEKNQKELAEGDIKKNNYLPQKRLSDGTSAIIISVKDKGSQQVMAMKRFRPGVFEDYKRELECLKNLNHKNIIKIFDNFIYMENETKVNAIVLEYCDFGDLFKQLMSYLPNGQQRFIKPLKFLRYAIQLFEALDYMHSKGFVHSDIKPQNILLAKGGVIKLADFGFSVKEGEPFVGGTISYIAPEQEEGQPSKKQSDVYSAAYSLLEIIFKKKLNLKNNSLSELWNTQLNNKYFQKKSKFTTSLIEVLENGVHPDFTKRRQAKEIANTLTGLEKDYAANLIQKHFRGYSVRKKYSSILKTKVK
ncbi:hypothetical protein ABK040_006833 [Willaertia magna]